MSSSPWTTCGHLKWNFRSLATSRREEVIFLWCLLRRTRQRNEKEWISRMKELQTISSFLSFYTNWIDSIVSVFCSFPGFLGRSQREIYEFHRNERKKIEVDRLYKKMSASSGGSVISAIPCNPRMNNTARHFLLCKAGNEGGNNYRVKAIDWQMFVWYESKNIQNQAFPWRFERKLRLNEVDCELRRKSLEINCMTTVISCLHLRESCRAHTTLISYKCCNRFRGQKFIQKAIFEQKYRHTPRLESPQQTNWFRATKGLSKLRLPLDISFGCEGQIKAPGNREVERTDQLQFRFSILKRRQQVQLKWE